MSDDLERWKEKYFTAIEQQEQLERRWSARLDLLRRGLVRSTLAAEGNDPAVDQCMKEMREVVRTDDMDSKLSALLPRLEKAVLDSEQRRETRVGQIGSALQALVVQLQVLTLPREVRGPLKKFAKQLEERASQTREIPLLLTELSQLQSQVLGSVEKPQAGRPGLLQRLFGTAGQAPAVEVIAATDIGSEPPPTVSVEAVPAPSAAPIEAMPAPLAAPSEPVPSRPAEAPPASRPAPVYLDSLPLPGVMAEALAAIDPEETGQDALYALPPSPEPSYSSVASHIEATLLGLLDNLSLPERHQPQADAMRVRLEQGLNWYELLPILDDLAVLTLAINDSGQHEFETYLQQLNQRLASFQGTLQATSDGHADNRSAARALDLQLREQVDGLHDSLQGAADVDSLKALLDSRLEGLLGTMDQHQRQRGQREQEIAARLQGLSERVVSMENEAQDYREHLEEQRQRALIDPLTGLPNRAAWTERLDQAVAAQSAQGDSLVLAMIDLDHFKSVNDNYGHLAGDKVLKIIATQLRKHLRADDFIARFGGEEFVLLLPATTLAEGAQVLEGLRSAVADSPFHFKGQRVSITASMGATALKIGEKSELALKRADQALYQAKDNGRNRIETD
jgi:diguanylate cyclase